MPNFSGRTPEALLGRNDSKNPATTCKGITSSGRPCRRALAANKTGGRGVVAVLEEGDGRIRNAQFYCWQHQDQAGQALGDVEELDEERERFELKHRASIDTLMQRLGIDRTGSIRGGPLGKSTDRGYDNQAGRSSKRRETQGSACHSVNDEKHALSVARPKPRNQRKHSFWASLCCVMGDNEGDYVEIVRHRTRIDRHPEITANNMRSYSRPTQSVQASAPTTASVPTRKPVSLRPPPQHIASTDSGTGDLLALIPPSCSPMTTSALLAELSRPPNPNDEEGYIYIFWLTPQTDPSPSESTVRSLLSPNLMRQRGGRRISDVLTEYSSNEASDDKSSKTVMLKIGRASNVTRRMNEWQRQCGYAPNLVRWYPHTPSSGPSSPQPSPGGQGTQHVFYPDLSVPPSTEGRPPSGRRESSSRGLKVPSVKRVERLIHLELAGSRVKRDCAACGREHREWFKVEANETGVRNVDEVVKRWVRWAESQVTP